MSIKASLEKTYYEPTYLDNSHEYRTGKETGDWSGVLITREYTIKKYVNGIRLFTNRSVKGFSGRDEFEMRRNLKKSIKGMSELPKENAERDYVPPYIERKLEKFKEQFKEEING